MKDIDLAKMELRFLGNLKEDHREIAAIIFNIPVDKVTPEQEDMAKTVNFNYFTKDHTM